ncbi:MAG TPA: hypothetical protein VFN13_05740 [Rudaea sp.]|nr:hypothetical protein [Rudaea sp.]
MIRIRLLVCSICIAMLLAACSKAGSDANAPLAFVPADTPYVFANIEPTPKAVTDQWSRHMQESWPVVFGMYDDMLGKLDKKGDAKSAQLVKIAHVIVNEVKTFDNWDKLRKIGLKPDALAAFYGVGIAPVMRMELGDPAAFKAEIARIEQLAGETLPVGKTGAQEYWQLGDENVIFMIAIEGKQLVVTVAPKNASDTLKQTLLGMIRPTQSLAASGALQALAKQYDYSPYGEGFIDFTRIATRLSNAPTGTDLEIAKAIGLPTDGSDAACKSDYLRIAKKFPRLAFGAEDVSEKSVQFGMQLETDPDLAKQLVAALPAAPGTGAPGEGIVDFSVSVPLLKLKEFWLAQADAVVAKPFACPSLADVNEGFTKLKSKLDITIPPPLSDMLGWRVIIDTLQLRADAMPSVSGRLLFASNNPAAALAMAQLTMPALKDLKLSADGKPVALPAGLAPAGTPPLFAAMSDKGLAIGAGTGEEAALAKLLAAPTGDKSEFLRIRSSGATYGLLADLMGQTRAKLPAESQGQLDAQTKLFKIYEKWVKSVELTMSVNAHGIALEESVQQN